VGAATLVVALAAGWVLYDRVYAGGGDRPVAWLDLTPALGERRFARAATRVIESRAELREVVPGTREPPVDFARRRAVLVTVGPRSSPAYRLSVVSVREERRQIVVVVREQTPELGGPAPPRVISPALLLTLPPSAKRVAVVLEGRENGA